MLSHAHIQHFRAFGFVVLRGLLTTAEANNLHTEVEGGLRDAYGARSESTTAAAASRATTCRS